MYASSTRCQSGCCRASCPHHRQPPRLHKLYAPDPPPPIHPYPPASYSPLTLCLPTTQTIRPSPPSLPRKPPYPDPPRPTPCPLQDELSTYKDLEYCKTDLIATKGVVFAKFSKSSSALVALEAVCGKGAVCPPLLANPNT